MLDDVFQFYTDIMIVLLEVTICHLINDFSCKKSNALVIRIVWHQFFIPIVLIWLWFWVLM